MTPEQLDIDIEELSTRMERVRSLYEQYFMGIERLEPTIPRKDIERRIEILRKIRFQNTAKRFKFQTLIQRYNSLQQYWNRTCRDIENGTYKRHVQRAERRFGGPQAAPSEHDESLAELPLTTGALTSSEATAGSPAKKAAAMRKLASNDLASLLDSNTDLDAAMNNVLAEFEKKPTLADPASPAAPVGQGRATTTGLLGRLGKPAEAGDARAALSPSATGLRTKTSPTPAGLQGLPPLKSSATAPAPLKPLAKSSTGKSVPPRPTPKAERNSVVPPGPLNQSPPATPPVRPARPLTSPGVAGLPPLKAPAAAPLKAPAVPPPRAPAATQTGQNPAPLPMPPPRAAASPAPPPRAAASPAPAPRAAASPAPAPRAASPAPAPAPRAAVPSGGGGQLSEDRIRALHQSYVDARKQTNASGVSLEKLAKSLRDTEQQLRQKHRGRDVDFDVTIKDGKAILIPKLK